MSILDPNIFKNNLICLIHKTSLFFFFRTLMDICMFFLKCIFIGQTLVISNSKYTSNIRDCTRTYMYTEASMHASRMRYQRCSHVSVCSIESARNLIYVWLHSSSDRTNQNQLKCQFHKRRDSINSFWKFCQEGRQLATTLSKVKLLLQRP